MKKQKAAILSLDPRNKGGILSSLQALYQFLEQEYEVTVFFLNFENPFATSLRNFRFASKDSRFSLFGMNCFGIGARYAFWEPNHYTNTLSSWEKHLAGYDLFFVSSGTPFAAHPLLLLSKKFILWVATPFWEDRYDRILHGSFTEKAFSWLTKSHLAKIEKDILQAATAILPMSTYAKTAFTTILGNTASTKEMTVCPYPINPQPNIAKDYEKKIVIATGRFSDPRKNVDMLIRTWGLIEQEIPDAILIIIGQVTPTTKELIQKSATIFLAENINNEKKLELYQKASLALITSWQEGLGIIGLEALSCQVPIVSTDCGGVRDFVIPRITGELVPCNDHQAMATAATALLSNPEQLRTMGEAGARLIEKTFTTTTVKNCWHQALQKIQVYT